MVAVAPVGCTSQWRRGRWELVVLLHSGRGVCGRDSGEGAIVLHGHGDKINRDDVCGRSSQRQRCGLSFRVVFLSAFRCAVAGVWSFLSLSLRGSTHREELESDDRFMLWAHSHIAYITLVQRKWRRGGRAEATRHTSHPCIHPPTHTHNRNQSHAEEEPRNRRTFSNGRMLHTCTLSKRASCRRMLRDSGYFEKSSDSSSKEVQMS